MGEQVRILLEIERRLWERMLELNPWLRNAVLSERPVEVEVEPYFWDEEPVEPCPPFE